jgi:hydroxyacylglutathione hydrolase
MFSDNYGFLVIDDELRVAAAVDPADPDPVLAAIEEEDVRLTHILCTHHHRDHAGGNGRVLQAHPGAVVVAGLVDADKIPEASVRVGHGDRVRVGRLVGEVIDTPCHTAGHVSYLFGDALFCGDTLFVGGCGRFFEGDAAQMHEALNGHFRKLPDATEVYCAHEYTVSNLRFALSVDPTNEALVQKMAWANARRAAGEPTVPSTLGQERATNPFMRVTEPALQAATRETDPTAVTRALRTMKDGFR